MVAGVYGAKSARARAIVEFSDLVEAINSANAISTAGIGVRCSFKAEIRFYAAGAALWRGQAAPDRHPTTMIPMPTSATTDPTRS